MRRLLKLHATFHYCDEVECQLAKLKPLWLNDAGFGVLPTSVQQLQPQNHEEVMEISAANHALQLNKNTLALTSADC